MRFVIGVMVVVSTCLVADARPVGVPPPPDRIVDLEGSEKAPVNITNWDGDDYPSTMDCNDDNPAVFPGAKEIANGIDDDCDGVIDDGLDTSADWPTATVVKMLASEGWASIDATPRIVWADAHFAIVWHDDGDLVRFARVDAEGQLLDTKPILPAIRGRVPDIAWTGQHYGIAYQDTSEATAGIRLIVIGSDGSETANVLVAELGDEPGIVWAQDRFGVVWRMPYCAGDCLRFQRFDLLGRTIGPTEVLENSGRSAAIAFSGTGIRIDTTGLDRHDGSFGIAYEAYHAFAASGDVILAILPLEPYYALPKHVTVNAHADPYTKSGPLPSVAGNLAGFAVSWHVVKDGVDKGHLRLFPLDDVTTPIQEFIPDADAGRASSILWTGSEFIVVNDNGVAAAARYDVHFRRLDGSCNSHLAAGWGPWREINLSDWTPGNLSVHPDVARADGLFGIAWVEGEAASPGMGRVWFAIVTHR